MYRRVLSHPVPIIFLLCTFTFPLAALENDSISNDGLKFCISYYRDGYYNRTIECINDILPKLTNANDSLQAFKYLALSYGMINRIEQAESCFRQAIETDPNMEIDTLEFPPNIALIYKHVKLEKKVERISTAKIDTPIVAAASTQKSSGLPTVMLTGAILSASGAGFLFFKGLEARQDYSLPDKDQNYYNKTWNTFIYAMGGGVISTGLCSIFTWMFFSLYGGDADAAAVVPKTDGIAFSFSF